MEIEVTGGLYYIILFVVDHYGLWTGWEVCQDVKKNRVASLIKRFLWKERQKCFIAAVPFHAAAPSGGEDYGCCFHFSKPFNPLIVWDHAWLP